MGESEGDGVGRAVQAEDRSQICRVRDTEATLSGLRNAAIQVSFLGRSSIPLFGLEILVKNVVIL